MFPRFTTPDICNSSSRDTVLFLQCRARDVGAYYGHLYFNGLQLGQFGKSIVFTLSCSSFSSTVPVVVALGSKEQVLTIYARWVIATVKNVKILWDNRNFALIDHAGNSQSGITRWSRPDNPITIFIQRPNPQHAALLSGLTNVFIESFIQGYSKILPRTLVRTKPSLTLRGRGFKCFVAVFTSIANPFARRGVVAEAGAKPPSACLYRRSVSLKSVSAVCATLWYRGSDHGLILLYSVINSVVGLARSSASRAILILTGI